MNEDSAQRRRDAATTATPDDCARVRPGYAATGGAILAAANAAAEHPAEEVRYGSA